MRRPAFAAILMTALVLGIGASGPSQAQQTDPQSPARSGSKPNILMIMADDIGWFNVSAYNHGIMGHRTPNIDQIAKEGAMFTDWYGEQSCTTRQFGKNHLGDRNESLSAAGRGCG